MNNQRLTGFGDIPLAQKIHPQRFKVGGSMELIVIPQAQKSRGQIFFHRQRGMDGLHNMLQSAVGKEPDPPLVSLLEGTAYGNVRLDGGIVQFPYPGNRGGNARIQALIPAQRSQGMPQKVIGNGQGAHIQHHNLPVVPKKHIAAGEIAKQVAVERMLYDGRKVILLGADIQADEGIIRLPVQLVHQPPELGSVRLLAIQQLHHHVIHAAEHLGVAIRPTPHTQ